MLNLVIRALEFSYLDYCHKIRQKLSKNVFFVWNPSTTRCYTPQTRRVAIKRYIAGVLKHLPILGAHTVRILQSKLHLFMFSMPRGHNSKSTKCKDNIPGMQTSNVRLHLDQYPGNYLRYWANILRTNLVNIYAVKTVFHLLFWSNT